MSSGKRRIGTEKRQLFAPDLVACIRDDIPATRRQIIALAGLIRPDFPACGWSVTRRLRIAACALQGASGTILSTARRRRVPASVA